MLQNQDAVTEMMKEVAKDHPNLLRPLLEERDEFMVYNLKQLASRFALTMNG